MNNFLKTPLNYEGGKYKLLPQIIPLLPTNIDTFYDLFCGGCDVSLNVQAQNIVCNDIRKQLIFMYQEFQKFDNKYIINFMNDEIKKHNLSKKNKSSYLLFRDYYNNTKNPLDLYILICFCFNNYMRFNKKGNFNTPCGSRYFNNKLHKRLELFIDKIKDFKFTNNDFESININMLKPNDFIYCDPPYLLSYACYNGTNWTINDEQRLYEFLKNLDDKNIKFALSNVLESKGKINQHLLSFSKNFNIHYLEKSYSNCNYQRKYNNVKDIEVLITNY